MVKKLPAKEEKRLMQECIAQETGELRDYHGVSLAGPEWEFMQALEQLVHAPIPAVTTVKWNTFGFSAQANHVIALGLYRKGLTSLPDSLGNLIALTSLHLWDNKLTSLPDWTEKMLKTLHSRGCSISR